MRIRSTAVSLCGMSGALLVGKRSSKDGFDAGHMARPGVVRSVERVTARCGQAVVLTRRTARRRHEPGCQTPLPLEAREGGIDGALKDVREARGLQALNDFVAV